MHNYGRIVVKPYLVKRASDNVGLRMRTGVMNFKEVARFLRLYTWPAFTAYPELFSTANTQRFEAERNLQLALERQGRDIAEIRRQVNLWNSNVSSKEAYACWAQQQANPNLSEVPITQIPDIMRTNVEKGRPLFHGFLKSDYGASSSSQVDPEEPVPLQTAPPSPHFRPPYLPSN
ncbi:hypothetical protein PIB30_067093 [Stylosanthes scabra]|uniref:Uncharacterized protein n=1 Tax=Stylosanthes scabra TaxID=79078 RepID=A0ABU6YN21_9FABA|nr:hypothetical protein [Stylosanthes scabra]